MVNVDPEHLLGFDRPSYVYKSLLSIIGGSFHRRVSLHFLEVSLAVEGQEKKKQCKKRKKKEKKKKYAVPAFEIPTRRAAWRFAQVIS